MKRIIFSFLLAMSFTLVQAQQNYASLLNTYYQHSKNGFKDIIGEQTDSQSVFYPSTIIANVGEVKIYKTSFAITLN